MRESDSGRRSVRSLRTGSSSTRSSAMPRISEPFCRRENAVFRSPWAPDAVAWGRKLRGEFGRIRTPRKRKAGRGSQRTTGFVELASLSMLSDICIQLAGAVGGIGCRGRVSSSSHLEMPSCTQRCDISSTEPDLLTLQAYASSPRRRAGPSRFSSSRFGASRGRRPTPDSRRPAADARPPTPDSRRPSVLDCLLTFSASSVAANESALLCLGAWQHGPASPNWRVQSSRHSMPANQPAAPRMQPTSLPRTLTLPSSNI